MLLRTITLSNSGNVCLDGGGYILALGYECNRGIYQLQLRPTGEWDGLTIRACWHLPDGTSTTTLAVDGYVDVPAAVTALPGTGCITFEGAAEGKTITSSDLRYLVGDNSGVEDGTLPEPNTPAWEQLVGTVAESTAQAEEAADRADKAAAAAEGALTAVEGTVSKALSDINAGKNTALEAITHRKEDALAAVDRAKTDATGDVQTAKQEAVAAITHTGAAQTQAVTRAGEQAVQEVDAAAQAGVGSVGQAQQTATQAVQTAATAAIQRVEQTGSTQVQAVAASGAEQIKGIETTAAEKLEGITQLAGQAEDSATKAEQAAQRAEDAAAATSAIIDDTAITPAKTWSSLHILDALCPPIKATGNPVVCHPVEGYPLGTTVSFAPIQEGEGDPSPENVRPIKARKAVLVKVTGAGAESQTTTLTLPAPCYGGELDAVSGKGQETWETVTLDGTEEWTVSGKFLENKTDWYYVSSKIPNAVNAAPQKGNEICSHYPHADIANTNTVQGCAIVWGCIRVRWGDTIPDDADAWKTYLAAQYAAGTPVQIAHKLATPTPITATGGNPILALAGTNTVLTDGDSLTVTGREDPTHEIQQLRAAVVALGGHEPEDMAKLDKAIQAQYPTEVMPAQPQ